MPFRKMYWFHIFFWITYIVFLLMESRGYVVRKGWPFAILPVVIHFAIIVILAYGNIFFLIPRLLEKRRIVLYILGVILFIFLYMYGRSANQQYWDAVVWPDEPMELRSYFPWNILNGAWLMLLSSLLYFAQKWSEQRQQVKNAQINQLQTELKYLRNQVNPHFLFNGLNTIYGNIDIKDQKARDILLQFSDLLRYNLYEADVDLVDIEKEAAYLENYVALQRARSESNLRISLNINIENNQLKIAPLLFIPFVENAFKFASRDENTNNFIEIKLRQTGNRVEFGCINSYEEITTTGGIGYSNVKRRLELLYKDKYTLTINKEEKNYYVQLIIDV
jgi:two-component system, LytTR family, sensor kinase